MQQVNQLKQAYSLTPWRKQTQIVAWVLLFGVAAAVIALIHLTISAQTSTAGRTIQKMQAHIEELRISNADLQSQLGEMYSSTSMYKRAEALGFKPVDNESRLFLLVPGYEERQSARLAPDYVPEPPKVPIEPSEFRESIFDWLSRTIALPVAFAKELQK